MRAHTAAAALLATLCLVVEAPPGAAQPTTPAATTLTIDLSRPLEQINRRLVGFGWHEGGAPLASVAPLAPHLIRIDAALEQVSTGPDAPLLLDGLLARVATIRAIGAEPLVILSYLPAWLGEPNAAGRDPTRVRPSDLDAWEQTVHDVVHALATARQPALRFEAWNEPDVPLFWQDTPAAWVDTVERSARAVASVERETGLDLAFGGPATVVPDPVYLVPFLLRFRDLGLPLDFVSWHYYGNYPFFGPDGAEFPLTEPIQPILGRPNPLTSPADYGPQVPFVRHLVETTLAGSGRAMPDLVLDEWNLSAAGFDRRHDTATGAAFVTGVLIELQQAGLDATAYFRANDTRGVPGEHGLVSPAGSLKPAWWAFELWQRLADTRVAVEPTRAVTDDLWTVAAVDADRVTVLLTRFRPDDREIPAQRIELRLPGASAVRTATVRWIDRDHPRADRLEPLTVSEQGVTLDLPSPGIALVEVHLERGTTSEPVVPGAGGSAPFGAGTSEPLGVPTLPATGGRPALGAAGFALVAALALTVLARPFTPAAQPWPGGAPRARRPLGIVPSRRAGHPRWPSSGRHPGSRADRSAPPAARRRSRVGTCAPPRHAGRPGRPGDEW